MAKTKYIYNNQTCAYEPYKVSNRALVMNFTGLFSLVIVLSIGLIYVYHNQFTTIKEKNLKEDHQEILTQFKIESNRLTKSQNTLMDLQKRDDNIYRTLLDLETIPTTVRTAGIGGTNRFENIENSDLSSKSLVINQYSAIDKIKGQIYIQTKSYDELEEQLKTKRKMWSSRPAITPLSRESINRIGSGYRWRFHPIHKVMRFHNGIDITANVGEPIYASGDGVVKKAYYSNSYGNVVYIDHGFGYETRYAHMSKFNVKEGDKVLRGDNIGQTGNTGWSRGPHLHYEVLYKDKHIDPVPYLSKNLNPEEFEKLIQDSNNSELILDY